MCKATTRDIRRRQNSLNSFHNSSQLNIPYIFSCLQEHYSFNNAKLVIENWEDLAPNTNIAFSEVMVVFDEICKNNNIGNIKYATNIIKEQIIPKVRDAAATQVLIKRRTSRTKTKISTNINNNLDAMKSAVSDSINGVKQNLDKNINSIKDNIPTVNLDDPKDETIKEALDSMLYTADVYKQCDRVLTNHNKLSKRYNIDDIIREQVISNSTYDSVIELCKYIDTYNMADNIKYNVALENTMYGFDKNGILYDKKDIVNAATDYFILSRANIDESYLSNMKFILDNNKFFTESDIAEASSIFGKKSLKINESSDFNKLDLLMEDKNIIKDIINEFKTQSTKTVEGFKSVISRLYTKSDKNIINETPNLFGIIRLFFVLGTFALNPVLGLVATITDYCIKMKYSRQEIDKIINQYTDEISKSETKMKKSDNEEKERLSKYIDEVKKDLKKLEAYRDSIHSEEENEERNNSKEYSVSNSDFDDFGIDADFFKFESAQSIDISNIVLAGNLITNMSEWDSSNVLQNINSIIALDENAEFINLLCKFSNTAPDVLDPVQLNEVFVNEQDRLRRDTTENCHNYYKIDKLNSVIESLTKVNTDTKITETGDFNLLYDKTTKINECMNNITDIISIYRSNNVLFEMDFSNTLKLSIEKLKKSVVNLSDKEKIASRKIDMSMDSLQKSAQRALSNNNRESIIKGSVIPSASKIIKTAILTGAAWTINPAIAVIGLLGSLAVSKSMQHKERQLILDEIEIELKMVDRYIRIADDKNDTKSLKSYLNTQRCLERERQRIKYKMNVFTNKPDTSIKTNNDSN